MGKRRAPAVATPPPAAAPRSASGGAGGRAALALWIGLAALTAARFALTFTPGMWMWGLNVQRFLDPRLAWLPWTIAALALLPDPARRVEPMLARIGDAIARGSKPAIVSLALLVAGLVWGCQDNTRFVGDFLLRQGTVELAGQPGVLFPQALPLDVLIHYRLPTALQNSHALSANDTARLLGAINAAALAVFAAQVVRALGLARSAAFAAWAIVVFGGTLGMFTGYSKSLAELVVLAVAIAAFGLSLARGGRGALGLSVALAISLALHRAALGFLIPAALAWTLCARRAGVTLWRRRSTWIALALPIATLAWIGPRVLGTLLHVDVAVHLAPADARRTGILGAAFSGLHLLDLVNLVLLLSPLAWVAPLALAVRRGSDAPPAPPADAAGRGTVAAVLLGLALPMLGAALFVHPAQGVFRDWDDFAALGVTLSLIAAWRVGEILSSTPTRRWVAVPVALGVMMSSVQWLALHTDVDQGLARARAFVTEPPARPDVERAGVWDFLGIRNFRLHRWTASAEAFSHAAESAPSPRLLEQWAFAATMAGELRTAQAIYHRLVEKDPRNPSAWLGLGAVASRIPDVDDSFRAARQLLTLDPGNESGRQLMAYLRKTYPSHP